MKKFFLLLLIVGDVNFNMALAVSINNPDQMLNFVKKFLPESPVVLEAGGHFGEDTNRMKSVWPNAIMHVFEPLPSSFEQMLRATCNLKNVMCYPYALSTYSGKTHFFINNQNSGASSIGYPALDCMINEFNKTAIEVSCITINDWVETNKISYIDFMWLDMEGHELYALQHSSKILETVKVIYTEVDFIPIREGSCLYVDLKSFLELQGFCEVWVSIGWPGVQADALFIKKNLLK